ncbi:hypothetical protein K505DRAFT_366300 [Melanomma pulvis-pyrius CBS 109.77]|uniref:Uncharacterized protein n=1 Tax=Melanomma pulvis-pyrius CBS 109.77 TaxID=1314802 RepID=A0A6A6WXJ8_9PLEO|nr:hypothetical protein K505DRAFT_366300 [Melanomma pulvis-pyrius CBS 109.77]
MPRFIPRGGRLLVFLGLSTTIGILIIYYIIFKQALPMRRAYHLEIAYLHALSVADRSDYVMSGLERSLGWKHNTRRVNRLIEDVPQLHYWSFHGSRRYDEWLGLNHDGTGWESCKGREYWIYLGGTAEDTSKKQRVEAKDEEPDHERDFSHRYKGNSCVDPPEMCDNYNAAFNSIASRWHGTGSDNVAHTNTTKALLRYVDCDITPLFCYSFWGLGIGPVILAHLKIGEDCEWSTGIGRCPVTWRIVALPMDKAPWTRQIKIALDEGGSVVVPAFPTPEEQMWSLMTQSGAEEALELDEYNVIVVETVEDTLQPTYSTFLGLHNWGSFRAVVDNPYGAPEWPKELLVKCYFERWLDLALQWWDGQPVVVYPRSCEGVEEEREQNRRMQDALLQATMDAGF